MKILIVNNMAPFIWGGAEELAVHLKKNLIINGHQAEILRLPFQWQSASKIPSQMLMARAWELFNVDHVIALKFPAYLIRHPHKTLWLLHQYRQAYDLYDAGQTNLSLDQAGKDLQQLIKNADNESFRECRQIFTNSNITRQRLKHYNNIDAAVLLPPLNDPELFTGLPSKGYIFAGGRINSMKRQYLLLEALALLPKSCSVIIAGPPDTAEDAKKLLILVEKLKLTNRVILDLRFLSRQEYAQYINEAAAVFYSPYDEDSLGYVAMEAAIAGKPVITANDSGGILALVKHHQTGWIFQPDPEALSHIITCITPQNRLISELGHAAREKLISMKISWPQTIERLLS